MSCNAGKPNFRLLDFNVGWSASSSMNLDGLAGDSGIYLTQLVPGSLDPNQILPYIPPARLARGCGNCEWYLVTPAPPEPLLLRRDACHGRWQRLKDACLPKLLLDGVAIAVGGLRGDCPQKPLSILGTDLDCVRAAIGDGQSIAPTNGVPKGLVFYKRVKISCD